MALTQSARLAGPSWDEEVVPALRKRLESESRTLARRMSAISLSSVDEPSNANYSVYSDNTIRQRQMAPPSTSSQQASSSGAQRLQSAYQQRPSLDRTMPTATPRANGIPNSSKPTTKPDFQRARTYSSPFASDLPNGHANGNARPKMNTPKSTDPTRSFSPRPVDIKPTRIPKASRPPISLASTSASQPYTNGSSHGPAVTSSSRSPEIPYQPLPDLRAAQRGLISSSSTQSTVELPSRSNRRTSGLLNESPPFPTESTMSSGFTQPGGQETYMEEDPPRPSMESEERPYEHWYRGEVSRNGGVGELRVGRRQEMLDIANYGHLIEKKNSAATRVPPMSVEDDTRRNRKRAGSIAGITHKERERGSLYLDDENVDGVGRVLDENPLTDLDGEGSERRGWIAYAYLPGVGDNSTPPNEWTTVAGAHEMRSITPTPSMLPRPSSRQQTILPPTRIPGPSSRRSSESRSTATSPVIGAPNMQPHSSSSKTPLPPSAPSSSSNSRQQAYANSTVPTSAAQKRGASPASEDQANRGSVAYYPTPAGDGEDMADAIPSWTQPVPREGNWDEVVLPVVARKKGLDTYYENADGSPKPKKYENTVEPAPGTFGFDNSKYRPPRGDFESIPMDEFGRPADLREGAEENHADGLGLPTIHDQTKLPARENSPSPAPFSHYAPNVQVRVQQPTAGAQKVQNAHSKEQFEDDDKGAGCCKCVIM
ncbi:hypothetical protein BDZ97DRAFT_1796941 [Flammula alnicola]|nr:hypothetical protein BDZ97DRAFT_1796941 [Flammula alnicola]